MMSGVEEPIPYLTTEQMVEVDRVMTEELGIGLIQMMENAGRNLAHLARERFLDGNPRGREIAVLAGAGGNGGGALVAARRLAGWGANVRIFLARAPERFVGVPAVQLEIVRRIRLPIGGPDELPADWTPDVVLDGIIGYSLHGPPRDGAAGLIRWANDCRGPILSLDVPSGLDASDGTVHDPSIRATATMTLALPKEGLRGAGGSVGELYVADISVPASVYEGPGLELEIGPIFARQELIRLR